MTEEEINAIIDCVEKSCREDGFASLGDSPLESVEEANYEIPLTTIQAAIYGMLLSEKYTLNGKILTNDNSKLDSIVLLKKYLANKKHCTFDELLEKNLELTGVPNRKKVFQALYDSMVRIDIKAGFITGENICIDGGMTKLMIYHGDNGWELK